MITEKFKTISTSKDDTLLIVTIFEKRIFLQKAEEFHQEILHVLDWNYPNLVIDLSNLNIMSSTAIGVLLMARETILKRNGRIFLISPSPLLTEIFSRMHIIDYFEVSSSLTLVKRSLN